MSATMTAGTVLVAVDGSNNSVLAAGVGARLARLLNARVGLIHVVEAPALSFWVGVETRMKDEIREQAERELTEIAGKMNAICQIMAEYFIVEGAAEEEIPRVVHDSADAIMLVMGCQGIATERRSRLRMRHKAGHLAGQLPELLHVPLLVVPPDLPLSHICTGLVDIQSHQDAT
jgi:nucleotide-binding universal stress UspA family protein